jgi:hypothetical protein
MAQYHDDPIETAPAPSRRPSGFIKLGFLFIVGALFFQTTLAANINLGGNQRVEFGQGVLRTTACSGATSLTITPYSSFVNASGAGAFYFSSVKVSNIPNSCYGDDFTIKAFGNTSSAQLAIFNTASTNAVVYNNAGTFQLSGGPSGISITSGSGTFTITFTNPVALATSVSRITIESGEHIEPYTIGSTGPGGGKIFYIAQTPFACGPALELTCSYLEAAPTTGLNSWTDATYAWSGVESTAIGTTSTSIGSGYKNTISMINQSSTASRAGTISQAYRGPNNLTDWYLPSKDELNEMCKWQRGLPWTSDATVCYGGTLNSGLGAAGFTDGNYHSSTERDASNNWYQMFASGFNEFWYVKRHPSYVRPIRAF